MTPVGTGPEHAIAVIGVNYGTDEMALRFVRSAVALRAPQAVTTVLVDNTEGPPERQLRATLR